jgi:two-component system response regulator RegX3
MPDPLVVIVGTSRPLVDSVEAALRPIATVLREDDTAGVMRRLGDGWADAVIVVDDDAGSAGLDACRAIRSESDVPVIVVSSRDSEFDAVLALELGADDFVPARDASASIAGRCQLVLRRCAPSAWLGSDVARPLVAGDLIVDPAACTVTRDGRTMTLPPREVAVLRILVAAGGRVVPVAELVEQAWAGRRARSSDTLEFVIRSLRAKIEQDPSSPTRIVNVRSLGYKYVRHEASGRPTG